MRPQVAIRSVLATELLEHLREKGFAIGIEEHRRVERLLEHVDETTPVGELKYIMAPVLARNGQEQTDLYEAFNTFNAILARETTSNVSADVSAVTKKLPRRWPFVLAGCLLILTIAFVPWLLRSKKPADVPATPPVVEVAPPPPVVDAPLPLLPPHPPAQMKAPAWLVQYWGELRATLLATPLIVLLLWELYHVLFARAGLSGAAVASSPLGFPIPPQQEPPLPYIGEMLRVTAREARRRRRGELVSFAVQETVNATVRAGGYPTFRYRESTRPCEHLILVERRAIRDQQARLFDVLAEQLKKEDVLVARYFFDTDPRICYKEGREEGVTLGELHQQYASHRLLVFSSGDSLLDPVTGEMSVWTNSLTLWPDRALLTPAPPSEWGLREIVIAERLLVLPATLEGFRAVADFYGGVKDADWEHWWVRHIQPDAERLPSSETVDALRRYLGPVAFRWLCSLAVYPELHWNLTLHLGSAELLAGALTEDNLLRLVRLPWFRRGVMPDPLRQLLVERLTEREIVAVRAEILELLDRVKEHLPVSVLNRYYFDRAVQELFLFRENPKRRRAARRELRRFPGSMLLRDVTVVRELERTARSPLAFVLPRRIRRVIFNEGLVSFGMRRRARITAAMVAMVAILSGFSALKSRLTNRLGLPLISITAPVGLSLNVPLQLVDGAIGTVSTDSLQWEIDGPAIVRLDRGGITTLQPGETRIRGKSSLGAGRYEVRVTEADTSSLALARVSDRELMLGSSAQLTAVLADHTSNAARWMSCTPGVASVSERGGINGTAPGTALVLAITSINSAYGRAVQLIEAGRVRVLGAPKTFLDSASTVLAESIGASGMAGPSLPDAARRVLDRKARYLRGSSSLDLRIISSGDENEVERVRSYLLANGVSAAQIHVTSADNNCQAMLPNGFADAGLDRRIQFAAELVKIAGGRGDTATEMVDTIAVDTNAVDTTASEPIDSSSFREIVVPRLVGMVGREAVALLAGLQINARLVEVPTVDPDVRPGVIYQQQPAPGARINRARSGIVTLIVSPQVTASASGTGIDPIRGQMTTVPNLSGLSVEAAREALMRVGLSLGTVLSVKSSTWERGKVFNQTPTGDSRVTRGLPVNIYVSAGDTASVAPRDSVRSRAVIARDTTRIAPNESGRAADTKPALGPNEVAMPNVEGKTKSEAMRLLNELGILKIDYRVRTRSGDFLDVVGSAVSGKMKVYMQIPSAGKGVPPDSRYVAWVTLYFRDNGN